MEPDILFAFVAAVAEHDRRAYRASVVVLEREGDGTAGKQRGKLLQCECIAVAGVWDFHGDAPPDAVHFFGCGRKPKA